MDKEVVMKKGVLLVATLLLSGGFATEKVMVLPLRK
jgi:hypothetical protein